MSTQLRRLAQAPAHTPVRTKFFLSVADLSGTGIAGDSLVGAAAVQTLPAEAILFEANFSSVFGAPGVVLPANTLLRDLGRSVIVTDAACNHLYRYRQVQVVNGATEEGVPGNYPVPLYALVWSAAGAKVNVVRTG